MSFFPANTNLKEDYDDIELLLFLYDFDAEEKELRSKIASLEQVRDRVKQTKTPLWGMLGSLLVALILMSSCVVHAGNGLGFWSTGTSDDIAASVNAWADNTIDSIAEPGTDTHGLVYVLVKASTAYLIFRSFFRMAFWRA